LVKGVSGRIRRGVNKRGGKLNREKLIVREGSEKKENIRRMLGEIGGRF
jgi:hypothetical protein